jgi:hypothetical protein
LDVEIVTLLVHQTPDQHETVTRADLSICARLPAEKLCGDGIYVAPSLIALKGFELDSAYISVRQDVGQDIHLE